MSDLMDIDTVRSKYSDITVTAVPKGQPSTSAGSLSNVDLKPQVEITRVPIVNATPSATTTSAESSACSSSMAAMYAKEYAFVMARLEQIKCMQAQLAVLSQPLPLDGSAAGAIVNANFAGMAIGNQPAVAFGLTNIDLSANIVEKYESLLAVIAGMRGVLPQCSQGIRAPKDRLLRDISQARHLLRECLYLLERDNLH